MVEVISFFLFEGIFIWVIVMFFMWIGFYLIMGGINLIVWMFEIIFFIIVFIFLIIFFMSIGIFEIDNFCFVLGLGIKLVLDGIKIMFFVYIGFEIMLIFLVFME